MRWWTAYQEKLQAGGVVGITAKCLTSALIGAAGDLGCQVLIEGRSMSGGSSSDEAKSKEEPPKFDVDRFAKFTFLGGVLVAPTLHVWYGFLGRTIAGKTLTATVQRVSVDQFLFAPCFIATFFTSLAFLEGKTMKELETQLREEWPSAVVNNWKVVSPTSFVAFAVPCPVLTVAASCGFQRSASTSVWFLRTFRFCFRTSLLCSGMCISRWSPTKAMQRPQRRKQNESEVSCQSKKPQPCSKVISPSAAISARTSASALQPDLDMPLDGRSIDLSASQ
eukprot:2897949-Rhodomonas_salina.2